MLLFGGSGYEGIEGLIYGALDISWNDEAVKFPIRGQLKLLRL